VLERLPHLEPYLARKLCRKAPPIVLDAFGPSRADLGHEHRVEAEAHRVVRHEEETPAVHEGT